MKWTLSIIRVSSLLLLTNCLAGQSHLDPLHLRMMEEKDVPTKASLCIDLAKNALSIDLLKTKQYADKALKLSEGLDSLTILALDQKGKYYFYSNLLDSAEITFQKAANLAEHRQDLHMASTIGLGTGSVLLRQERYDAAIKTFVRSAEYFEKSDDQVSAAKCYSNIAAAHASLENWEKAIFHNENALGIFKLHQLDPFTLITLPNLATLRVKTGDTLEALSLFKQAENLAIARNDNRSLALIYNNLGDLHLSRKNLVESRSYFLKCIDLKQEINQLKGIENNYHNLAYTYALEGDHMQALKLYEKALETANASVKIYIYDKMQESHQAQGDLVMALLYANQSKQLRDSLKTSIDVNTFAEISTKYESTKRENEILQLEAEKQSLEVIKARNKYILIGLISLILVSGVFVYLFIKNQKRKQIINSQAHHLEKQQILEKLKGQESATIDQVLVGQHEERSKIAADLHDSLGSKMATLKLYLDHLEQENDQPSLAQAQRLATMAYEEVRNISHNLGSGVLPDQGLLPALRNMASFISSTNQLSVEVLDVGLKDRLKNATEIQVLRIIQELVTNVIKHAEAKHIILQLTQHESSLNIIIEDDGNGFDLATTKLGLGLNGIEDRIEKIDGQYFLDSSPGHGTTVVINIPL